MKRIFAVILAAAMLSSCGSVHEGRIPEASRATLPSEVTVATYAVYEDVPVPESELPGFEDYTLQYTEIRDRKWEDDVISAARTFLRYHPKLTPNPTPVFTPRDDGDVDIGLTEGFFDPALRERFVYEIGELLPEIPQLSDVEILLELQRIIAGLDDTHSLVKYPYQFFDSATDVDYFPYTYELFYTETGTELRVVAVPPEENDLCYAKLLSINGVSVDEILERLGEYVSSENIYGEMNTSKSLIMHMCYLRAVGVVGREESSAEFEFELEDGSVYSTVADAMTLNERNGLGRVNVSLSRKGALTYKNSAQNYWYEYIPEDGMLYVRINRYEDSEDYTVSDFFAEVAECEELGEAKTVVIDQRGNHGGTIPPAEMYGMAEKLDESNAQVYLLIDDGSFSATICSTAELHKRIDGAVSVGFAAGQPANFFASEGHRNLVMANSKYSYTVSDFYFEIIPGDTGEALMPDVEVIQTLEDYKASQDSVLVYLLSPPET